MAIDVYLQIEGIKGESQDSAHQDWIECTGVNFGVLQPRSATSSTAGGHTTERAEVQDVTFSKMTDLATPVLLQTCAVGKTLPKAKFQFMRADGDGKPVPYFEIELENLIIGAINPGLEGSGLLSEHVSLKSSRVKWKYTQQKISGGAGGSTIGGWDSAANKVI